MIKLDTRGYCTLNVAVWLSDPLVLFKNTEIGYGFSDDGLLIPLILITICEG